MSTATPTRPDRGHRTGCRAPRSPDANAPARSCAAPARSSCSSPSSSACPFALVELVGNPLPSTLPTRAWFDAELTASAVLDVLAAVLWLVWAHFVVCVLAETRAWVAGGGTARVPGGTSRCSPSGWWRRSSCWRRAPCRSPAPSPCSTPHP